MNAGPDRLTVDQRKALHSTGYVERFCKEQSSWRLERLLPLMEFPREAVVADFACGNGMMLDLVAKKVSRYCGVDFSEDFIAEAERRISALGVSNAEFFCESIQSFCRKNPSRFDAAFAMDISEHVYDDEWSEILGQIRESLKPGGFLYLHTPNLDFFLELLKDRNLIVRQFPEHIAVRNMKQNIKIIRDSGFNISRKDFIPHYNILRFLHPLSNLPAFGRYFRARLFIVAQRPPQQAAC